jgi:hypothetical protein
MPARPPARGDVVKGEGFTLLSGGGDVGRVGDVAALMSDGQSALLVPVGG